MNYIHLADKWYIGMDSCGYTLATKKKKKDGPVWYSAHSYYSSLASLAEYLPEKLARNTDGITTLNELVNAIHYWCRVVSDALKIQLVLPIKDEKPQNEI
jgi:hypothetical protein